MSARIARGGSSARGGGGRSRAPARAKGKGKGRGAASTALPDAARKAGWWLFLALLVVVALGAGAMLRLPQMLGVTVGEAVGEAGFAVKRVEIKGAQRVPQIDIYNVAFDQPSTAMPLVDLEATRQRLLRFGWVRDARVSRRLPDTLVVDIVERQPAAIWQHNRRLALIDGEGVVLAPVQLDAMPDLPLVIGPAANHQAGSLGRLLEAAPQLRPQLEAATWVGGRRWDLRFQSGEVLALPEGEATAVKALGHFVRMDQSAQLLGRGFTRFDMRIPGKFVARISDKPGSSIPELIPQPPATPAAPAAPAPVVPSPADGDAVDPTKTI